MLVLVAALVGGCGGGDSTDKLATIVTGAPGKTLAEGTSRVSIDVAVTGSSTASYTADGEFDFKGERGRLNLDLSKLGIKGAGDGEVRFNGDFAFLELKADEWLKVNLAQAGASSGVKSPTAQLYYLQGVSGPVRKVGTEAVRGEATTRYAVPIDLDRTARQVPAKLRAVIRQTIRRLGTSDLATEAWIDGGGRLRRLRYVIDLSTLSTGTGATASGKQTLTYEFFEFGVPVEVSEPPAAEVTDLAKLSDSGVKKK